MVLAAPGWATEAFAMAETAAVIELIRSAEVSVADHDLRAARTTLGKAIADPAFEGLDAAARRNALRLAGRLALESRDYAAAHALLVRATTIEPSLVRDWHARFRAALMLENERDAARCLAVIARHLPDSLASIDKRTILRLVRTVEDDPAAAGEYFDLLAALFGADWKHEGLEPGWMWFEYARLLVARGDLAHATEVARRVPEAMNVLALRVDRRFDVLTRARAGAFDIGRSIHRQRVTFKRRMAQSPGRAEYVTGAAMVFLETNDAGRALAVTEAAIARVGEKGLQTFTDASDRYNWLLEARSRALAQLGRWDEAVAQQRRAARSPEGDEMNVSQALNLARFLAMLERPREAREAMEDLGAMSAYGRMHLAMNHLLIALVEGDRGEVDKQLAWLREHRDDAIRLWQAALVQADRLDEAASVLIERLRREDWRSDALLDVQGYAEVPLTPRHRLHMERWHALLARDDVKAAIEKVGRRQKAALVHSLL